MKNFNSLQDILSPQPSMLLAGETYIHIVTYYNVSQYDQIIDQIIKNTTYRLQGCITTRIFNTIEVDILKSLKAATSIKGLDRSLLNLVILVRLCYNLHATKVFDELDEVLPPHLRIKKLFQLLIETATLEARSTINKKLYISWEDACKHSGDSNVKNNSIH